MCMALAPERKRRQLALKALSGKGTRQVLHVVAADTAEPTVSPDNWTEKTLFTYHRPTLN